MATASVDHGMLWTDLEGRELPGGWRLKRLLRPEGRNAWFEAVGADGKPATVSLTEALNDEEELLARLGTAATIHHPNVVAVRDSRLAWVDDTPVVMAAMEPTDENLAEVLRERALDAREARQLLDALLQGLAAIHARRLTHGRMEAGSVLAMGNTVKLRSDCVHVDSFVAGAVEDVRGVGRIVTQALTRRIPASENDPILQLVPESMGRAVRRALSGQAMVEEVAALAGTRIAKAQEPVTLRSTTEARWTTAAFEIKAPEESERKEGSRSSEMRPEMVAGDPGAVKAQMDLPLIPRWKKEPETTDEDEEEVSSREGFAGRFLRTSAGLLKRWNYHRRGAPWVIGTAVALAIATAVMLHGWVDRGDSAKAGAASERVVVLPATAAAPVTRPAGATRVWRVVVYTYRERSEAEQQARDLGQRYPQLRPGVMAVRGGDFLVTLGGAMSREAAIALRGEAVGMGLPRDTYAQNFR